MSPGGESADKPALNRVPAFCQVAADPAYNTRNLNICTPLVGPRKRSAAGQCKKLSGASAMSPGGKSADKPALNRVPAFCRVAADA
ncbi:hypothetical protein CWM52_25955 [Raoultella sp. T31]|nr:hypothetical protein CWM52_25955 [Raoultella sp. T31]